MKIKLKVCAGWDNNSHPAFIWKKIQKKPYCQRCALIMSTDKERLKKEIKKQNTILRHQMFKDIWGKLTKKSCWSCNRYLGEEASSIFFDHLLDKAKYPNLDLTEENIYIVCGDCHQLKTNSTPTETHKKAIEKAKINLLNNDGKRISRSLE